LEMCWTLSGIGLEDVITKGKIAVTPRMATRHDTISIG
jgi:hypothetical protein